MTSVSIAAAIMALTMMVGPAGATTSTLSCPIVDSGEFAAPAPEALTADAGFLIRDVSGEPLMTWAGYMVDQPIIADGDDTYIAYFDENQILNVAKQTGPDLSAPWAVTNLGSKLQGDSHNAISMALDTNGNLHVAGNVHTQALQYWATTVPGDISTLRPKSMFPKWGDSSSGTWGSYESLASYPEFYRGVDEQLFFRYRSGQAGQAWTIVYQFNTGTSGWELQQPGTGTSGLAKVFAGYNTVPNMSAYPSVPKRGPDGNFHMVWTWRNDPTAGTNSQVHYAYSADLYVWRDVRGTIIPGGQFTYGQEATLVDDVPEHGGLLNDQIALGFNGANKPVISYAKYVGTGAAKTTQLFMARPVPAQADTRWESRQLTSWVGRYDLENDPIAPNTLTTNSGAQMLGETLAIDYVCQATSHRLFIDPVSGSRLADIALPPSSGHPAAVTASAFGHVSPAYEITYRLAVASTNVPEQTRVLKWEAGPYNSAGAKPVPGTYPAGGSPMTLFTETLH